MKGNDNQQFKTLRRLGSGAYGNVFEVKTPDESVYAIKVYSGELSGLLEFSALFAAGEHPNIISLRKYTVDLDRACLSDSTVNVRDNNKFMAGKTPGPGPGQGSSATTSDGSESESDFDHDDIENACSLALFMDLGDSDLRNINPASIDVDKLYLDMCAALTHLHSRGIIHGDIKPENILWNPKTGHYRLVDFSLAEFYTPHETLTNTVSTLNYRAPEVVDRSGVCFGSDWFSLGMTLLEIVNDNRPIRTHEDDRLPDAHKAMYAMYPTLMQGQGQGNGPHKAVTSSRPRSGLFCLKKNLAPDHMLQLLHQDPSKRFLMEHYDSVRSRYTGSVPIVNLTQIDRNGVYRSPNDRRRKKHMYEALLSSKMPRRIFWQILYVINKMPNVEDLNHIDFNVLRQIYENIFYRTHIEASTAEVMDHLRILRYGIVFQTPYECGYGRRATQRDIIERTSNCIFFMPFSQF